MVFGEESVFAGVGEAVKHSERTAFPSTFHSVFADKAQHQASFYCSQNGSVFLSVKGLNPLIHFGSAANERKEKKLLASLWQDVFGFGFFPHVGALLESASPAGRENPHN